MTRADAVSARLAAGQNGVLTIDQLRAAGVPPSTAGDRRRSEVLVPVHRGVHRHGAVAPAWTVEVAAAVVAGGPRAVGSHLSAGRLHTLVVPSAREIDVTVPDLDHPVHAGVRYHRTNRLEPVDVTTVSSVPVTTVARTLLDLGALLPYPLVARAGEDAILRRLTTLDALTAVLERVGGRGRRGTAKLRAFLREAAPDQRLESILELRLLEVLRQAGLGEPELQYDLVCDDGRRVRLDAAYPGRRLAVEADGHRWHASRADLARDLARSRSIQSSGWRHLRYGWSDLHENLAATRHELRRVAP